VKYEVSYLKKIYFCQNLYYLNFKAIQIIVFTVILWFGCYHRHCSIPARL